MERTLDHRLLSIERSLRIHKLLNLSLLLLLGIGASAVVFATGRTATPDVVRTKGLIVEDSHGNPRVIISASLSTVPGRTRTDEIDGIVYLDSDGTERLTFGKLPDPMTANGIESRRVGGAGVLIHDKEGIERGGYSVLDDETALLTLDWPKTGEAVALSSRPEFSGVGLFYRSDVGLYRDSIGMFTTAKDDRAFLKVTDTSGRERAVLISEGTSQPRLLQFDGDGKKVDGKL